MFEVSDEASEKINQFLEGREGIQVIRVLMTEGGWRGPYLVMALDELKEDDEVFTEKGVTFVIEKNLWERVQPILSVILTPLWARVIRWNRNS